MSDSIGSIPQIPITIKCGSLFYLPFTYTDADKNVIPLTGYNARLQIWGSPTSNGTAIADIGTYGTNLNQGVIAINGTTFQITITLHSTFTETLRNTILTGCYEFHLFDPINNDIALFEGPVCFEPGGIR
jgi:hypothetical protein